MKTKIIQFSTFTFLAITLLAGKSFATETELKASGHESIEVALAIENWMIDADFWDTNDNLTIVPTIEETLPIESWMFNNKFWLDENKTKLYPEQESALTLESWMMNENTWVQ